MIFSLVLGIVFATSIGAVIGWHFGQVKSIHMLRRLIAENQTSPAPDDVRAIRFNTYIDVLREIGK